MQVLKESVKQAILESAEEILLASRYSGMGMRDIAKLINMSVSNLYKYFPDKKAIYHELVYAYYIAAKERMTAFLLEENEGNYTEENIRYVSAGLTERLMSKRNIFLILMENSDNPECYPFKSEMIESLSVHILDESDKSLGYDELIIRIIVKNIWDGIYEIIKDTRDKTLAYERIYHLLKYHFTGLSLFHDLK